MKRKDKHIRVFGNLFIAWLFILSNAYVKAQIVPNWVQKQFDTTANFYEIQNEVNTFYNNNTSFKTGNDFHYKDFKRWEWFWTDRVSGGNVKDGSFKYATNAIKNAAKQHNFFL